MRKAYLLWLLVLVIMATSCLGGGGSSGLRLTILKEGEGIVTAGGATNGYVPRTYAYLEAIPATGWRFLRWEGDVDNPNAAKTNAYMDKSKTIKAIFAPQTGTQSSFTAGGVSFAMRAAPAATFPIWYNNTGTATVATAFCVAETQVTYELWYVVRQWALQNGYTFANAGLEGSTTGGGSFPNYSNIGKPPTARRQEPVTMVNWFDSIVWCNALSEMLGLDPVYRYLGSVLRNAASVTDAADVIQGSTRGFRLPTGHEWELAARYKGSDSSHGAILRGGLYWTPGNYASGATANYENTAATQAVAWYDVNSLGSTRNVKTRLPNGLGVFDMSGNVSEWCFTQHGQGRMLRGGAYNHYWYHMPVSETSGLNPSMVQLSQGFRFVRSQL